MSSARARRKHVLRVFWNERVYSTAVLSVYCGQVTTLVAFGEIENTGRRCKAAFPTAPPVCVYDM